MIRLRGNHRLVFRSYLIIAFGVISLGLLLDWVLVNAQEEDEKLEYQPWLNGTFLLIERRLLQTPESSWDSELQRLAQELGMPLHILSMDDIAAASSAAGADLRADDVALYYDANDAMLFYKRLPQHDRVVSVGPVASDSQRGHDWLRTLIPLLFYSSVFVLVWIWIRPLMRDLDTLNTTAEILQRNYRQTIPDFSRVTTIRPLAESFKSMTQRLRALIEGQQEFTNALSHELRTPLARIKFGLELLKKDLPESANKELQNLRQDVQEIDELIGSMLDYARLEHPDLEIQWRSVPAQQFINETVNKFQQCSTAVTIEVVNEVGRSEVECDPYLMGLSLSNLLSNALRYAKTSVHISFQRLERSWRLQVDDDGPGVPEESRARVLKAFARLDDSRDRGSGGYGLGLAIVNRIAGLHGGSVRIEQSSLGGASLSLCWPIKQMAGIRVNAIVPAR